MKVKLRSSFFFNNVLYEKTAVNDGIVDLPIMAKKYLPKGAVILDAGSASHEAQDAEERAAEARRVLRETEQTLQAIDPTRAGIVAGQKVLDEAELRQKVEAETRAKLATEFNDAVAAAVAKALAAAEKEREAKALLEKKDEDFDADLTKAESEPAKADEAPAGRRRRTAA